MRRPWLLAGCLALFAAGAGPSRAEGYCPAAVAMVRDLPPAGVRSFVLYWPAFVERDDGMVDIFMYAQPTASPEDASAQALYDSVARMTHYIDLPEVAQSLASCLKRRDGFKRLSLDKGPGSYRAEFTDRRTQASVVLDASKAACQGAPARPDDVCLKLTVSRPQ